LNALMNLSTRRFRPLTAIVLLAGFVLLLWQRWATITSSATFNPDEEQALANAYRIAFHGLNWNSLDGTTVGPLNSLVLCWPYVLGLEPTIFTTRLTAAFLQWAAWGAVALIATSRIGMLRGVLVTIPLLYAGMAASQPDLLHYSSELFPLLLLTWSCVFGLADWRSRNGVPAPQLIAAFLLGLVPFAKLQASPIAVVLAIWFAMRLLVSHPRPSAKHIGFYVVAGLLPAIAFLVPLAAAGGFSDFWKSYIIWSGSYVGTPLSATQLLTLIAQDPQLSFALQLLATFSLGAVVIDRMAPRTEGEKDAAPLKDGRLDLVFGTFALLVTIWVIAHPGREFLHYTLFIPPIATILTISILHNTLWRIGNQKIAVFGTLAILGFGALATLSRTNTSPGSTRDSPLHATHFRSPHIHQWLPFEIKHTLVWGWMPRWHFLAGVSPATRESHTYGQIHESPLRPYFRQRFLADLADTRPEIVVDGVHGQSFGFSDPNTQGPATFPGFEAVLQRDYVRINPASLSPACPVTWLRQDLVAEVSSRVVAPQSISASATYGGDGSEFKASNLVDRSLTEDTCSDHWLLPDGTLGTVTLGLDEVRPLETIMILNTSNRMYGDRAAKHIMVRLFEGQTLKRETTLKLQAHPYWNRVSYDSPVRGDRVELSILDYWGAGGGLNEIVLLQPAHPNQNDTK